MRRGKCYIGTSGWSYAHWAKGVFYPKGLKPGDWLPFVAGFFNTVEVNSSFYRLPKAEMVTRWRMVTGGRFRFAVKLWRRITHQRRLRDCDRELNDFLAVAAEFGPKRGPLLVQLPPTMQCDPTLLETFLVNLKRAAGRSQWRATVEFRHGSWLCPPVYDLLNRHGAALCLADLARCSIAEPNDAAFVYMRRHGPTGAYRGLYAATHIKKDAAAVRGWLQEGRDVYVYYNNDIGGYAVTNALQLVEALSA